MRRVTRRQFHEELRVRSATAAVSPDSRVECAPRVRIRQEMLEATVQEVLERVERRGELGPELLLGVGRQPAGHGAVA